MRRLRRKIKKVAKKGAKKLVPVLGFIPVVGTALTVGVVVAKARRNAKDEKIASRLQEAEVAQVAKADNTPTMNKVGEFFAPVADFFGRSNTGTPAAGTSPLKADKLPTMNKVGEFFAPVADFFERSNTGTPAAGTSPLKSNKLPLIIGGALVLGLVGFLYMRKR